jgi:hypothetical protein
MGKPYRKKYHKDSCYKHFLDSYKILSKLRLDECFIKAAHGSTNPKGFQLNVNTLLSTAMDYNQYRISLSASNGRSFFDSAFPTSNHNGKYVQDLAGDNISIAGAPEFMIANLYALDALSPEHTTPPLHKKCIGSDGRWDETVEANQYFVAESFLNGCKGNGFVLRVSKKPEVLLGSPSLPVPIQADRFAVVNGQQFAIIAGNAVPVSQENIATTSTGERFAIINGNTIKLP